jgi:hypothetical protein
MTWENLRRILWLPGKTSGNHFFLHAERCINFVWRMGWGGLGKAQNEAWGGVWAAHASQEWGGNDGLGRVKTNQEKVFGRFMVPKSGAGRVWRRFNAHLNNKFLLRCVGKRNWPHEIGLPRWKLAGTEEGSKWSMGRDLGLPPTF